MTITCISDSTNYGSCYQNEWYIPADNTTFNCFGNGCYKMSQLYTSSDDFSNIDLNIHSCGKCGSIGQCLDYFRLFCGSLYSNNQFYDYDYGECRSYEDEECQCQSLLSNANFYAIEGEDNCYESVTTYQCDANEECTIYCGPAQNCSNLIIDGSDATNLIVNCELDNICQDVFIYCPSGECDINCDGYESCKGATIWSEGKGVSLKCSGGEYACQAVELNAPDVGYVSIETNVQNGMFNANIKANNVDKFFLNASSTTMRMLYCFLSEPLIDIL